ncbi:RNA ligase family protein [Hyalangium rubrum]|uniref:RNA ligase family protein n=1 Tax=Hyalangium rubrum TaxID=3103134 RepID=A0ABU5HGI4_9BACT|nr:RNA ligase family protein [Hyalangium sp. s54d21]MDY7232563.1 RNA ligase family protein [Hyalangium sp. s54d21]
MRLGPDPEFRPLGGKAYGSIPHLPGSRTGPADRHLAPGLARRCTDTARDGAEHVVVLEKLDGSCVAAARLGDTLVALGREGRLAAHSPNEARRLWAAWVAANADRFLAILQPGERLVGEWLALAHGTRYALPHEPFVCFDLMRERERLPWRELVERARAGGFVTPGLVHEGGALSIEAAMERLRGGGFHGAVDPVEGAVWRVERRVGETVRVDFLAKYVRPDKIDGSLLPENTGLPSVWNWRPEAS